MDNIREMQIYLREEIMDKQYDVGQFTQYLEYIKPECIVSQLFKVELILSIGLCLNQSLLSKISKGYSNNNSSNNSSSSNNSNMNSSSNSNMNRWLRRRENQNNMRESWLDRDRCRTTTRLII